MTVDIPELDAHEQPSEQLKGIWKSLSKTDQNDLLSKTHIDDINTSGSSAEFVKAGAVSKEALLKSFREIARDSSDTVQVHEDVPIYYHPLLPGLLIIPSLVPPEIQKIMLAKLIHRDLSQPHHQTNMHLHYDVPYPENGESFFSYAPESSVRFEPKDPAVHKPLSTKQVMERRLHWVTLGGQYDWTNRIYPGERPPLFPQDVAGFLEALFPETKAQAAIVNFYTPGDTMMMHRDVSEETDKGLISLSFGCDALFMIAPNDIGKMKEEDLPKDGKHFLLLRIRSGDAIYMTKDSRFAWHGVPKVLKGTCPPYLAEWPAEDGKYEEWRGWMQNKRINLNVRQMQD